MRTVRVRYMIHECLNAYAYINIHTQILRVGNVEAAGMNVTDLRNIIVGDQGTRVPIRFRCVCVCLFVHLCVCIHIFINTHIMYKTHITPQHLCLRIDRSVHVCTCGACVCSCIHAHKNTTADMILASVYIYTDIHTQTL